MATTWLLDTSALLTLRDDEPGAARVAQLLAAAATGREACLACFVSLMELTYRVWLDEDEAAARLAHAQCLSLPLTWVHETPDLLLQAASFKARFRMSFADAWVAAAAAQATAVLVHKDPELAAVGLPQEMLPLKLKVQSKGPPKGRTGR